MSDINEQLSTLVKDNKVVLFMKGTRMFPQCGFSARAIEIFKRCGVEFKDVNVLADPAIRQGIKDFSNWPTIPQAYVDGEFLGGSDILLEMFENGELQKALGVDDASDDPNLAPPKVSVSDSAKEQFASAAKDVGDDVLRFETSASFDYDLFFGPKRDDDFIVSANGLTIHVPRRCAKRVDGASLDFVDGPDGAGFKIDNPHEPPKVKNIMPKVLKAMLDEGKTLELIDVRGDKERALASIEGGKVLDADAEVLADVAKDATIVVYCHHGVRSRTAAEQLLQKGFTNVHNLVGGIDAWSATVDSSVARY
jgi:monothiol glutaredoxin